LRQANAAVCGAKNACPNAERFFANEMTAEDVVSGGVEPWTTSGDELAKFQASETVKRGKVIKAAGIKPDSALAMTQVSRLGYPKPARGRRLSSSSCCGDG
jgi:hypothetical protein